MRILVTGASGFVGARIVDMIAGAVSAPSLKNVNEDEIKRLIDREEPDLIIHTAAVSDISACAKDPDVSYKANVQLPVWLARAGVRTVLFSSDQVYSGCKGEGPYIEKDAAPANLCLSKA